MPEPTSDPGPDIYARAARAYLDAGWDGPLPLPPRKKQPVPAGFTGRAGEWPGGPDIWEWMAHNPAGNIALRLPENVIGIDIDAYPGKPGAATLIDTEHAWGALPPTWRTTSRDDGVSGIRLYVIPEGLEWPNEVGPGIEIIRFAHRYAIVWPSIHPDTGHTYKWVADDGLTHIGTIPTIDELPTLPTTWVQGLTGGRADNREARTPLGTAEAQAALTLFNEGEPCRDVTRALNRRTSDLNNPGHGSRHDIMLVGTERLVRLGIAGHTGITTALTQLRTAFLTSVAGERGHGEAEAEWDRSLQGALANVHTVDSVDPCIDPFHGLIDRNTQTIQDMPGDQPRPLTTVESAQPAETKPPTPTAATWFDETATLRHIREWAQSLGGVSPWAALLVVLTRLSADLPPEVVLPPLGAGPRGSLNLFTGLIGPSNDGKSSLIAGHDETLVPRPTIEDPVAQISAGTGEGIIAAYTHRAKRGGEWEDLRDAYQAFMVIDEIGQLEALMGRAGATIDSTLRTLWNGSTFSNTNADPSRVRKLAAHSYRLGLIMGIQPGRGKILIDENAQASGLTQRILFAAVTDPAVLGADPDSIHIPAPPGPLPRAWHPNVPIDLALLPLHGHHGAHLTRGRLHELPVPSDVSQFLLSEQVRRRVQPNKATLDGHELFNQLRVAALLSILHGGDAVTTEWWDKAEAVIQHSRQSRQVLLDTQAARNDEEQRTRGRGDAVRQSAADTHRFILLADRIVAITRDHHKKHNGEGCTGKCYTAGVSSTQRDLLTDAMQLAVDQGRMKAVITTPEKGSKAGQEVERWMAI